MKLSILLLASFLVSSVYSLSLTFPLSVICHRHFLDRDAMNDKVFTLDELYMLIPIIFNATLTVSKYENNPSLQYRIFHDEKELLYPFIYLDVIINEEYVMSSWTGISKLPIWSGTFRSGMGIGTPNMRVDIKAQYLGNDWVCMGTPKV